MNADYSYEILTTYFSIEEKNGGKIFGCFAIASERRRPCFKSSDIFLKAFFKVGE